MIDQAKFELQALVNNTGEYTKGMLEEAYRLGLNAGLVNKLTEGTFEWAMQQMRQGMRVGRRWRPTVVLAIKNKSVDGNFSVADIIAEDWEIVPEPKPEPEGHDFKWAAEQIKNGKTVRRTGWGTFPWSVGANATVTIGDTFKTDWVLAWEGGQSK